MPEVIRKMNVRSPFYVVADSEGIPGVITVDPDIPADFVIPTVLTQNVECDTTVNVGRDIGKRIFRLNVGEVTGQVSINYTIDRVPITIGYNHGGNEVGGAYYGSDAYAAKVTEFGGQISNLVSGNTATGTLTFNKNTETPTYVDWIINAPMQTEGYSFTFTCPTIPEIDEEETYATPPTHSLLVNRDPYFYFPKETPVDIYINNTKVTTGDTLNGYYVISDFDNITPFKIFRPDDNISATFISKSTHIKEKFPNTIEFRFKEDFDNFQFKRGVNGIFYNTSTTSYEWANAIQRRPMLYDYTTNKLIGIQLSNLLTESSTMRKDTRVIFKWDTGDSRYLTGTFAKKYDRTGVLLDDEYYGAFSFSNLEGQNIGVGGVLDLYFITPPDPNVTDNQEQWIPRSDIFNALYSIR